ncbi:MAG: hypothetical protein WC612_01700 [Bdellovibrionales bacterium]
MVALKKTLNEALNEFKLIAAGLTDVALCPIDVVRSCYSASRKEGYGRVKSMGNACGFFSLMGLSGSMGGVLLGGVSHSLSVGIITTGIMATAFTNIIVVDPENIKNHPLVWHRSRNLLRNQHKGPALG